MTEQHEPDRILEAQEEMAEWSGNLARQAADVTEAGEDGNDVEQR